MNIKKLVALFCLGIVLNSQIEAVITKKAVAENIAATVAGVTYGFAYDKFGDIDSAAVRYPTVLLAMVSQVGISAAITKMIDPEHPDRPQVRFVKNLGLTCGLSLLTVAFIYVYKASVQESTSSKSNKQPRRRLVKPAH